MRRSKFAFFFALIAVLFCGTSFASELADDMVITGSYSAGYTVSNWYSSSVTVTGGVSPYTFKVTSGDMPAGFFIRQSDSDFYLEGTPDTIGTYTFTLRVIDQRDRYTERTMSVTISGEQTEAASDDMYFDEDSYWDSDRGEYVSYSGFYPKGTRGTYYSDSIYLNGGVSDYTFTVSGTVPPGMYIRQSGTYFYLEGTPTTAGDNTFTLRAVDGRSYYTEVTTTISIAAGEYTEPTKADDMSITASLPTSRRVHTSYSGQLNLIGNSGSARWYISDGALPPGMYLDPSGSYAYIKGNPSAGGEYSFTLRAVDTERNKYAEGTYTIKINHEPYEAEDLTIAGSFTTNRRTNESYESSVRLNIDNTDTSDSDITWTVVSGEIPPGLSLNPSKYYGNNTYLTGIPNTGGTYTFTLRATDSRNAYVERRFSVKINDKFSLGEEMLITGSLTSEWRTNESYSSSVSLEGGEGNIRWSIIEGELPPGLSFKEGSLSGIPNTGGTYIFILRASDSRNYYVDRAFTIKINDTPYAASDMSITNEFDSTAEVGKEYSSYISASDYSGNRYWTLTEGTIPPGLSLHDNGYYYYRECYISGTPYTPGTYSFTVRLTDDRNAYTEKKFIITVSGDSPADPSPAPQTDMSIGGTFKEGYTVSNWYENSVQVTGGTSPYTFLLLSGSLPPGFYIRQEGEYLYLQGIPNTAGTYTFTLRVIDQRNLYADKTFTVKINGDHYQDEGMSIAGTFADTYTLATWYDQSVKVNGAADNYSTFTFNITSGDIPPGFYIYNSGTYFYLSGVPTTPGKYSFTLKATDRRNAYVEKKFTMNIYGTQVDVPDPSVPVSIQTVTLPDGSAGDLYSADISAEGDVGKGLTWTVTGLPDGLSYTANNTVCTIGGTPSVYGTFTVNVKVSNTLGEAERNFALKIADFPPISILTASLDNAATGREYNRTLSADDAITSWKVTAGSLPAGLTLTETTGVISGIVSDSAILHNTNTAQDYLFTVTASNDKRKGTKSFTIKVYEPLTFVTESLPRARTNEHYTAEIEVSGTLASSFALTPSENVPSWLSQSYENNKLILDGYPSEAGSYTFSADVQNDYNRAQKSYTLAVVEPVSINTYTPDTVAAGQEYSMGLYASGHPTSWTITSGDLPPGFTLNESTGLISGTVREESLDKNPGRNDYPLYQYEVTVTAVNNSGESDSKSFSFTVYVPARIITESLPEATEGEEYSADIKATGTGNPLTVTITNNDDIPAGLSTETLSDGALRISGTPEHEGNYLIRAGTGNAYGSVEKVLTLTVNPRPKPTPKPQITMPGKIDVLVAGRSYSFQFTISGDNASVSTSGTLPDGLTFDPSTGILSGTVSALDSGKYSHNRMPYSFTINAKNRGGNDTANVNMSVWYPPEFVTDSALPDAELSTVYNQEITASGTEASMTWKKTAGNLPSGLKLITNKNKRTCAVTGVPTKEGTYNFTLSVSAADGLISSTETREFTITVNSLSDAGEGEPAFSTTSLPDGAVGGVYFQTISVSGHKPITWKKSSGTIPSGLKLDTKSGTISGLPKKPGTYTFEITASNKSGGKTAKTVQSFTLTVTGDEYKKPSINSVKAPSATVNSEFSLQLSAKGTDTDDCPITWSFANNKYPSGLTIDSETGLISGTPKEIGNFSVKVKAENNIGSATKSISIKVNGEAPEILNETLAEGTVGKTYSEEFVANGTNTSKIKLTWSKSGTLPSGLKLDSKTGVISGTPKKAGTFTFNITAKNKYGKEVKTFTMTVNAAESTALPEKEAAESESPAEESESPQETVQTDSESPAQNYAVPDETAQLGIDSGIESHNSDIDMWAVSGDEELRGEIYAPEGQPLTFMIGTWPRSVKASDIEIFIADEAIAIEVDDDGTFTLPGELVSGEFVIYAEADGMKTIELYVVAESEEQQ